MVSSIAGNKDIHTHKNKIMDDINLGLIMSDLNEEIEKGDFDKNSFEFNIDIDYNGVIFYCKGECFPDEETEGKTIGVKEMGLQFADFELKLKTWMEDDIINYINAQK